MIDPLELAGWAIVLFTAVFALARWFFRRLRLVAVSAEANRVLGDYGEMRREIQSLRLEVSGLDAEVGSLSRQLHELVRRNS